MDKIYFNAKPGTPAAQVFVDHAAAIEKNRAWVRTFAKEHGLVNVDWIGYEGRGVFGFAPKRPKCGWTWHEQEVAWSNFFKEHPLWRRHKARAGSRDWATPRKRTPEEKALREAWKKQPRIPDYDDIRSKLTGVTDFFGWLEGNTSYGLNWHTRPDKSVLVLVPHIGTVHKEWKPLKGLVRGNQDKLRAEWLAVTSKKAA